MAEYVMSVAARHSRCMECERTPCVEVGCEIAPQAFTARRKDKVIRCRDCKKRAKCQHFKDNGGDLDGFCKWGEKQ